VFNQFDQAYSVNELAETAARVAREFGLSPTIEHPPDPRVEAEQHYYNPIHERLPALGYHRTRELEEVVREIYHDLLHFRRRLEAKRHVVAPTVQWRSVDSRPAILARNAPAPAPPAVSPGEPTSESPPA
jgi:hypothetical protein